MKIILCLCLVLVDCHKQPPAQPTPPPEIKVVPTEAVRNKRPSGRSQIIQHCVVTNKENENTVTCECDQVRTKIDSKTGRTTMVCSSVKEKGGV
jgi:hypothetical protein